MPLHATQTSLVAGLVLGLCATLPSSSALAADTDPLAATVTRIGHINGQALACKYAETARRAKAIVIDSVTKTREYGERYESATNEAFLAMAANPGRCPGNAQSLVELEVAARALAPVAAASQLANSTEEPAPGINPRYLLQATNGRAIMDGDFPDRFQLISFGYTFCPDICPTTLLETAEILKQLGDQAERIQPIFISVDPERDTLAQLKTYTEFFDPRIIGATGSTEFVKRAAANFKVRYEKVAATGADATHYSIDHTAGQYLLAPGGQFMTRFVYGMPVADIVTRLREEIKLRPPVKGPLDVRP